MKIAVTGSSGLVGTSLVPTLESSGHQVLRLVRGTPRDPSLEAAWDPSRGLQDPASLEGVDAVVHLAGKSIAAGRWNDSLKREIRDSRLEGTARLCDDLVALQERPTVLVSASAVGYYGDRGEEELTETSGPGSDFLARVCIGWEEATDRAAEAGIRVVNLRFGMILSAEDGALAKMLPPFKMGVGGKIGDGRQFWPWISIQDVVGVIRHALQKEDLSGPVNATAPETVRCAEFTKSLGRVLHRPTIFPMPAFAARLAFGEMADALMLASQRVRPARLQESGYTYRHPELEPCLRDLL